MDQLDVVAEGWNLQSLPDLLGRLADGMRAQRAHLARIRDLLASRQEHESAGVPAHTLDALVTCLEGESLRHAETVRGLSSHLSALAGREPPPPTESARLARLLGRRRSEEESLLGFLEFAGRVTAAFTPPEGASAEQRALYLALAAWDCRERARLRAESDFLVPLALVLDPALGRDARPISLDVHHREILARGGRRREASVFCPVAHASVAVDWCRGCPLARRVGRDTVECTPAPARSDDGACTRLGDNACVGEVMGTRHVSALPEVSASEIAHALGDTPAAPVVVVDGGDRLLGVIEPFAAASAPRGAPACTLTRDRSSISESASLADAVDLMVKGHARHLPVVRSDGRVVGTLADLDALRWVARGRQRGR